MTKSIEAEVVDVFSSTKATERLYYLFVDDVTIGQDAITIEDLTQLQEVVNQLLTQIKEDEQ